MTEYFTGTHHKPVKDIAKASNGGPATLILSGMAAGKVSRRVGMLVIAADNSYFHHRVVEQQRKCSGAKRVCAVRRGDDRHRHVSRSLATTWQWNSFGPISDNANGIGEWPMVRLTGNARQQPSDLDAVGNTTKAITKGVAIGSAVIAAVSLFGSYPGRCQPCPGCHWRGGQPTHGGGRHSGEPATGIRRFLIGGVIPWLFSSISIKAVERAAA